MKSWKSANMALLIAVALVCSATAREKYFTKIDDDLRGVVLDRKQIDLSVYDLSSCQLTQTTFDR